MHTWPVPGEYEVTLDCEFAADTYFDVYISDVSGLQVPTRMVADTEGREGSVTVYNAGPADAEVTLTVTGEYDGEYVSMLRVENGVVTEEPIFDEPEIFLLHSGHSASFVFFFSMDVATTIEWTANAATEGDLDVNPDNNLVEERTIVKSTSGGGGGH